MSQPTPVSPGSSRGLPTAPVDLFSSVWPSSTRTSEAYPCPPTASPMGRDKMRTTLSALLGAYRSQRWSGTPASGAYHRGPASAFPEERLGRDLCTPHPGTTTGVWPLRLDIAPKDLKEALEDLKEAPVEAEDEGFPPPTGVAMRNAARLIRAMYGIHAYRLDVYPTADGEIAIDAGVPNRSVILLCDASGGALCLANTGATHRRAHYSDADQLPDGFLREALTELVDH